MTQKSRLRAEFYARALRASHNRKGVSVLRAGSITLPSPSEVESANDAILKPDLSSFCICFCIEESAPLFALLVTPRQELPLLLLCNTGVAARWPQLRFLNAEMCFRDEIQPASVVLRQGCPFRRGDRFSAAIHEAEVL